MTWMPSDTQPLVRTRIRVTIAQIVTLICVVGSATWYIGRELAKIEIRLAIIEMKVGIK